MQWLIVYTVITLFDEPVFMVYTRFDVAATDRVGEAIFLSWSHDCPYITSLLVQLRCCMSAVQV